ncbi:MAG: hypothetical protein SGI77_18390 [Pirellulaceae bacterium]|nr:hypothetical protein [Pirellulaceae bacterium]
MLTHCSPLSHFVGSPTQRADTDATVPPYAMGLHRNGLAVPPSAPSIPAAQQRLGHRSSHHSRLDPIDDSLHAQPRH